MVIMLVVILMVIIIVIMTTLIMIAIILIRVGLRNVDTYKIIMINYSRFLRPYVSLGGSPNPADDTCSGISLFVKCQNGP